MASIEPLPSPRIRNEDIVAAMPIARRFVDALGLRETARPSAAVQAILEGPDIPGLVAAAGGTAILAAALRETHPWMSPGMRADIAAATVLRVGLPGGWTPSFSGGTSWDAAGMLAVHAICGTDPGGGPLDRRLPLMDVLRLSSARILAGRMAAGDTGPAVLRAVTDCPWVFHPSLLRAHGHLDRFWSGHPALMLHRSQDAEGLAVLVDTMPQDLRRACANGHACVQWFAERHGLSAGRLDRGCATRDPVDGVIYVGIVQVIHKDMGGLDIPWPVPLADERGALGHPVVIPADLPTGALAAWVTGGVR